VIGNDGGVCKEVVLSSGGRSFQIRGAMADMAVDDIIIHRITPQCFPLLN